MLFNNRPTNVAFNDCITYVKFFQFDDVASFDRRHLNSGALNPAALSDRYEPNHRKTKINDYYRHDSDPEQKYRISFGTIHDCDPPFKSDGSKNDMWTENQKIRDAIVDARTVGLAIRRRVSIPDFERFLGGDEESKDKPLNADRAITEDALLWAKVQSLLNDLINGQPHDPFLDHEIQHSNYLELLQTRVFQWAVDNKMDSTVRFSGPG